MRSYPLTTGIIIVAPHEVQAIAVPTLQQYGFNALIRVPAHLTLLYPFVEFDQLGAACEKLRSIFASVSPFAITMDGYGYFPTVSYMKPANPGPVQDVFRRIFAAFPECPPYRGQFGNDLHPHMTVGEFSSEHERQAAILPEYPPTTFCAERIHVIYGIDDAALPWITYTVIPFGEQAVI
jgi:2'-5' RNA ligase